MSAAVSAHLALPLGLVRLGFALTALAGGAGALLYAWLWALTPLQGPAGDRQDDRQDDRQGDRMDEREEGRRVHRVVPVAGILLVPAGIFAAAAIVMSSSQWVLVPGLVECTVLCGIAVAWTLAFDPSDAMRPASYASGVRAVASGTLILTGAAMLVTGPGAATAVVAVLMIVLGVAVAFIPRVVRLWSDLIGERAARASEHERAEIAAHLHDSVLQTLAIIQNRAGPKSEVARLARAQERELRDWLFAGTDPFAGDIATELHSAAAALELEHEVRFDVVVVGDASDIVSASVVGAAREAMLNAARHAGGDVAVYLEASPEALDVFVRDRGSGFVIDDVPAARMGIRESVVGRMRRAGGTATVRSDAAGTEVHLRIERGAIG